MKYGIQLETKRLIIRSWNFSEPDRKAFHELSSDEQIMQFFPFRRTRKQADERLEWIIDNTRKTGFGWAAVCLKETGEPIGFIGLSKVDFDGGFPQEFEIGWRLIVRHWRKGYATEAASTLLQHGFEDMNLDEIIAFAVPANTGSIAVMKRLGMHPVPALDFDHPGVDDAYAHLRRHVFYSITKSQWRKMP